AKRERRICCWLSSKNLESSVNFLATAPDACPSEPSGGGFSMIAARTAPSITNSQSGGIHAPATKGLGGAWRCLAVCGRQPSSLILSRGIGNTHLIAEDLLKGPGPGTGFKSEPAVEGLWREAEEWVLSRPQANTLMPESG